MQVQSEIIYPESIIAHHTSFEFCPGDTNAMVKTCWVGLLREMRHGYITSPRTKKKLMVWKEPKEPSPKKFKTVLLGNKVMCTVFWDAEGVIWQEYLLKGTTINVKRYCEMIKNLCKAIKRKRPGLLMNEVILLHDNARLHSANVTQKLSQQFQWDYLHILPIPPTSHYPILHFF